MAADGEFPSAGSSGTKVDPLTGLVVPIVEEKVAVPPHGADKREDLEAMRSGGQANVDPKTKETAEETLAREIKDANSAIAQAAKNPMQAVGLQKMSPELTKELGELQLLLREVNGDPNTMATAIAQIEAKTAQVVQTETAPEPPPPPPPPSDNAKTDPSMSSVLADISNTMRTLGGGTMKEASLANFDSGLFGTGKTQQQDGLYLFG